MVKRALDGDRGAFAVIVETYKNVVYGICLKALRNHHDAQDMAQEVFLCAYRNLDTLAEPAKLRAWLCKIAQHRSWNELRRASRRLPPEEMSEELPDRSDSPEDKLLRTEEIQMLTEGLASLPEHLRVTVNLRYLHGLSTGETAKILNIPEGTVKSRLSLAIGKLRKEVFGMEQKKEVGADFVRNVMSLAESLRRYTTSPDFDGKYKEVMKQVDSLPDSKEKSEARATALMFRSWNGSITEEDKDYIKAHSPAKWQIDDCIERYLSAIRSGESSEKIDAILAEGLEQAQKLGEKDGEGEIRFWTARRLFDKEKYEEALAEFERAKSLLNHESSYYPNAIAAERIVGKRMETKQNKTVKCFYAACGETVHFDAEHAYFVSQPGFSNGSDAKVHFHSIFYFASRVGNLFYDMSFPAGESIKDKDGNILTCISRSRTVTIGAGTFENCVEYFCDIQSDPWSFTSEIIYKEDVGLVSIHIKNSAYDETYELTHYEIKGGSGLLPLAVGNRWHYTNPALPSFVSCDIEREVAFCDRDYAGIIATQFATIDTEIEKYEDADAISYIERGDELCCELKFREPYDAEKVGNARRMFCRAMQLATRERDAILAEAAWQHLEKRAGYVRAGYRLLPSSVHLDEIFYKDGKPVHGEVFYLSPYYILGRRAIDNKIFGMKTFRWLMELCGTLFDPRWAEAAANEKEFTETRTDRRGEEIRITAHRGGTVATRAGVFRNCLVLTILKGNQDGKWEYYWQPKYQNVGRGKKTYYFAPDVGIVKLECSWGETLSSVCELSEYRSVSTSGEYMPLYYGMEWHYDEVTLREKYQARVNIRIAGGTPEHLYAVYEQDFCYLASEEEYEAARNLKPKTE